MPRLAVLGFDQIAGTVIPVQKGRGSIVPFSGYSVKGIILIRKALTVAVLQRSKLIGMGIPIGVPTEQSVPYPVLQGSAKGIGFKGIGCAAGGIQSISLSKAVENDEEFYALVQIKTAENLPPDSALKERSSIEKRMAELSGKVRMLFDGHAKGVIDDRNYEMLMKDIQAEQKH